MVIRRLNKHPSAQCNVIWENNELKFISYTTLVLYTEKGRLYCTGTYSPTTRKQIGWFLREYFPQYNYYDIKKIANTEDSLPVSYYHI